MYLNQLYRHIPRTYRCSCGFSAPKVQLRFFFYRDTGSITGKHTAEGLKVNAKTHPADYIII